jgi:hypothetical protein
MAGSHTNAPWLAPTLSQSRAESGTKRRDLRSRRPTGLDRDEPRRERRRLAGSGWRPGAEWLAYLPLVAEGVDDPADPPAVLIADG